MRTIKRELKKYRFAVLEGGNISINSQPYFPKIFQANIFTICEENQFIIYGQESRGSLRINVLIP